MFFLKVLNIRAPMMVAKKREKVVRRTAGNERKGSITRGTKGKESDWSRASIKRRRGIYRARARHESRVRLRRTSHRRGLLKRSFRESLLGEKSACTRAAPIARDVSQTVRRRHGNRRIGPMREQDR